MSDPIQLISLRPIDLMKVRSGNAFVGGSNCKALEELQAEVQARKDFGKGAPEKFRYCYYARSANAQASENKLLNRAKLNLNEKSGLKPSAGFVFVCTYGKRHQD